MDVFLKYNVPISYSIIVILILSYYPQLDLWKFWHRNHWIQGLQQLSPLCLVVKGAAVGLWVSVLGAEGELAAAAVAVCYVYLLSAIRLSTSWFWSLLPLWSA